MHRTSMNNMKRFVENYLDPGRELNIFDIGSRDINGNYRHLFKNKNWKYYGADIVDGDNVDILLSDPSNWEEIVDENADVVISGQTLEHVKDEDGFMNEVKRILAPGGLLILIAPSAGPMHEEPDYRRYDEESLERLVSESGLEKVECYIDSRKPWKDAVIIAEKKQEAFIEEEEYED